MKDFAYAVEQAAWWTRYALDIAPDADVHPGVVSHLIAAQAQHRAVENLIKEDPCSQAA